MSLRAVLFFMLTLAFIRIAGRRSFGQRYPFDACTTVLLGAVLSRAVVGASPFWPTLCSGAAIVLLHRLIALASLRWPSVESWISGEACELVRDGRVDEAQLRHALMTHKDLQEAIRKHLGDEGAPVRRATLERDGAVSVLPGRSS